MSRDTEEEEERSWLADASAELTFEEQYFLVEAGASMTLGTRLPGAERAALERRAHASPRSTNSPRPTSSPGAASSPQPASSPRRLEEPLPRRLEGRLEEAFGNPGPPSRTASYSSASSHSSADASLASAPAHNGPGAKASSLRGCAAVPATAALSGAAFAAQMPKESSFSAGAVERCTASTDSSSSLPCVEDKVLLQGQLEKKPIEGFGKVAPPLGGGWRSRRIVLRRENLEWHHGDREDSELAKLPLDPSITRVRAGGDAGDDTDRCLTIFGGAQVRRISARRPAHPLHTAVADSTSLPTDAVDACIPHPTPHPCLPRPAPPHRPHHTTPHHTTPHHTAPYRTAPHRTAPCFTRAE